MFGDCSPAIWKYHQTHHRRSNASWRIDSQTPQNKLRISTMREGTGGTRLHSDDKPRTKKRREPRARIGGFAVHCVHGFPLRPAKGASAVPYAILPIGRVLAGSK